MGILHKSAVQRLPSGRHPLRMSEQAHFDLIAHALNNSGVQQLHSARAAVAVYSLRAPHRERYMKTTVAPKQEFEGRFRMSRYNTFRHGLSWALRRCGLVLGQAPPRPPLARQTASPSTSLTRSCWGISCMISF